MKWKWIIGFSFIPHVNQSQRKYSILLLIINSSERCSMSRCHEQSKMVYISTLYVLILSTQCYKHNYKFIFNTRIKSLFVFFLQWSSNTHANLSLVIVYFIPSIVLPSCTHGLSIEAILSILKHPPIDIVVLLLHFKLVLN